MKHSGLKNRFNQELLQEVWAFDRKCLICGLEGADGFHHIMSPSSQRYRKGSFNSSILNALPIHNFKCHIGKALHSRDQETGCLIRILRALIRMRYFFQDKDYKFIKIYKDLYDHEDRL